jgi:hypothetical protein
MLRITVGLYPMQGDRFLTSSAAPVQIESPHFRNAVIAAFPNSVAALLYKNFAPSTQGAGLMTLRTYVVSGLSVFSSQIIFVRAALIRSGTISPPRPTCRTASRS